MTCVSLRLEKAVFRELQRDGLLLESDPRLPSLTHLVAGEPMKNSWWGHPKGSLILKVIRQVVAHRDTAVTKLVSGKVTFVHRKLWPALFAVATSREAWQALKLLAAARALLNNVTRDELLRTDEQSGDTKSTSRAARELERRLLVYAEQFHSEAGSHAKRLETWEHWAKRVGFSGPLPAV